MAETARPLEILDVLARRHGCALGIVSSARGPRRDGRARIEALELRNGTGPWYERELVSYSHTGGGLGLPLEEAAEEMIGALGRQGWLDPDPRSDAAG